MSGADRRSRETRNCTPLILKASFAARFGRRLHGGKMHRTRLLQGRRAFKDTASASATAWVTALPSGSRTLPVNTRFGGCL